MQVYFKGKESHECLTYTKEISPKQRHCEPSIKRVTNLIPRTKFKLTEVIHARKDIYEHFDMMMKLIHRNGKNTVGKVLVFLGNSRGRNHQKRFASSYFMLSASIFTTFVLSQSVDALCNDEKVTVDDLRQKTDEIIVLQDKDHFENFLCELRGVLSEDQIELDEEECRLRGKPWSSYHTVTGCPRVIASPSSTEQVIFYQAIKSCSSKLADIVLY